MKTFKTVSLISGLIGVAGVLLAPAAMSAPGKGWDTFNMGQGDPIPVSGKPYSGTSSAAAAAGKGWDTFNMRQGAPIPPASKDFKGASGAASASEGWAVFYTGERNTF
ncbi:MAG: hypothetical protein ROZ09_11900 [Thiobacillus sp.]|jgi:hypothetical protein|uniref:hypothetical protein n=1 Tax=Thiobacillus sp. TaxID=924 RepID=UPI002894293C|nr:hypothetical protein [Thiobacillus sp.]MDT3707522.1 hypothetical protein [Thiobacillus sp.]